MLTEAQKQKIKLAYEADRKPVRNKNGNFLLRFGGGGFKYLVRDGKATDAGTYYNQISNEIPKACS